MKCWCYGSEPKVTNKLCTTHEIKWMVFPSSSSEVVLHCGGYRHVLELEYKLYYTPTDDIS